MEAKQSFIAFLDADDEWYPDYLESIANLQGAYPECQVFATSYIYKDGEKSMLILHSKGHQELLITILNWHARARLCSGQVQ
ncbi:MAG: hypothetical protein IPL15_23895 [Comamonadaceae bacterium]|nr:hypothetical protein [Comamonadaceae bacterium]